MRNVHQISIQRAADFLWSETGGRIFSAYFMKNDGSMRSMVCRRGVKRHLRGGKLPYDPKEQHVLPVFDLQKKDYRSLRLDRLVSFNIGGETFILA
ncbi:MAG: SH3 beta-barrel fold-containing protein [Nitrososphaera sp.]|nr:SH3 beta-barrel fold-containing protein [Nitrososphaera sp.]